MDEADAGDAPEAREAPAPQEAPGAPAEPSDPVGDPAWLQAAATAQGRSHIEASMPCQDAAACRVVGSRLVAAVSDGAGSARLSEQGARAAVAAAITALEALDLEALAAAEGDGAQAAGHAVLATCRAALEGLPAAHDATLRDFHCTLVAAVAGPAGVLAIQLGDGFLVDRAAAGEYSLVFPPQHGEYVNQTFFLTQPDYLERAQVTWRGPAEFLALSTDGLERLALDCRAGTAHAPFFAYLEDWVGSPDPEVDPVVELAAFLAAPPVRGRTEDDVGLVLARRREVAPAS